MSSLSSDKVESFVSVYSKIESLSSSIDNLDIEISLGELSISMKEIGIVTAACIEISIFGAGTDADTALSRQFLSVENSSKSMLTLSTIRE